MWIYSEHSNMLINLDKMATIFITEQRDNSGNIFRFRLHASEYEGSDRYCLGIFDTEEEAKKMLLSLLQ